MRDSPVGKPKLAACAVAHLAQVSTTLDKGRYYVFTPLIQPPRFATLSSVSTGEAATRAAPRKRAVRVLVSFMFAEAEM